MSAAVLRPGAGTCLLAVAMLAAGCRASADDPVLISLLEVEAVTTAASGLLAGPADLAVGPGGDVYVADQILGAVVRLGVRPATIGRPGQGPGEFRMPLGVQVDADTIRVDDRGNGRVQVLTSAGHYVRSFALPLNSPGEIAMAPGGEVALSTSGLTFPALAVVLDREGYPRTNVDRLLARPVDGWDLEAMKAQVRSGKVPEALRNTAAPAIGSDGAPWLVLLAEGVVRRYDRHGSLMWSAPLRAPEVSKIRKTFFRVNREDDRSFAFYPLSYAADAVLVEGRLWVLLNTPDDEPSAVLVVDGDGRITHRLVLPSVRGARDLDVAGGRLYVAVPSSASVLAARLPAAVMAAGIRAGGVRRTDRSVR